MTRRCSHCGHNGHNSRTCPNRVVKLFGVRLTDGSIRKSASMGNLTHVHQNAVVLESPGDTPDHPSAPSAAAEGYASEDFVTGHSSNRERKKGVPWTEEEHRMFLLGLQKLGKGDWRGIAHNYVISRTPTQVASHAQKYFIRQSKVSRRKRRSSLFDIIVDDFADTPVYPRDRDFFSMNPEESNTTPPPATVEEECESMESANSIGAETMLPQPEVSQYSFPIVYPAYVAAPLFPVQVAPISFWSTFSAAEPKEEIHQVVKPTAIHAKTPMNVDHLVGMSKLSLECTPSPPSLKLVDLSTRSSAFHAKPGSGNSSRHNPIHAV